MVRELLCFGWIDAAPAAREHAGARGSRPRGPSPPVTSGSRSSSTRRRSAAGPTSHCRRA